MKLKMTFLSVFISMGIGINLNAQIDLPEDISKHFPIKSYPEQTCLIRYEIPVISDDETEVNSEGEEIKPPKPIPTAYYALVANIPLPDPLPASFDPQNYTPNTIIIADLKNPMENGKRVIRFGSWEKIEETFRVPNQQDIDEDEDEEGNDVSYTTKKVATSIRVKVLRKRTFGYHSDGSSKDEFINGPEMTLTLDKNNKLIIKDSADILEIVNDCKRK